MTHYFGQSFEISDTIDTVEFIKQAKQLKQPLERDVPRLIESIKNELAKIGQTLDKIGYNQRYVTKQTEEKQ